MRATCSVTSPGAALPISHSCPELEDGTSNPIRRKSNRFAIEISPRSTTKPYHTADTDKVHCALQQIEPLNVRDGSEPAASRRDLGIHGGRGLAGGGGGRTMIRREQQVHRRYHEQS